MEAPSSFLKAFTLQPGSTTMTLIGRQLSSTPRAMTASMMRSACASVMVLMSAIRRSVLPSAASLWHLLRVSSIYPHDMPGIRLLPPSRACAPHLRRCMPTPPPIAIERLVKIYKTVPAVDGISFTLTPGSITGLLGGNGAGKTTTIATIMGLITPTSGRVTVLGAEMPRQRYRVLHRMNFESPYVDDADAAHHPAEPHGVRHALRRARPGGAHRSSSAKSSISPTCSTGRPASFRPARRPACRWPRRLINAPELLLLDEPTASLDPDTADWVRGRLERYRRERNATVLLASHNMAEVERLCDRVIIMKRGRIEDDDTPAKLLARYGRRTLEEVFLDVARGRGIEREAAQ